jgi:[ribosomal protein S5]-alanine N-acetyltransferase
MDDHCRAVPRVLSAPGCTLRVPGPENAEDLFAVYGNGDTMRYMQRPPARSLAECLDLIALWSDEFHRGVSFRWGVFPLEEPRRMAGTAALHYWSYSDRSVELGCDLHSDYQGRGLATGIAGRLIECAFSNLGANRVELRCDPGNAPSIAIAGKLGFTCEGTLREYVFVPGRGFVDESVYSLLRREWKE